MIGSDGEQNLVMLQALKPSAGQACLYGETESQGTAVTRTIGSRVGESNPGTLVPAVFFLKSTLAWGQLQGIVWLLGGLINPSTGSGLPSDMWGMWGKGWCWPWVLGSIWVPMAAPAGLSASLSSPIKCSPMSPLQT